MARLHLPPLRRCVISNAVDKGHGTLHIVYYVVATIVAWPHVEAWVTGLLGCVTVVKYTLTITRKE